MVKLVFLLALFPLSGGARAAGRSEAERALARFETAFATRDTDARQNAVYDLHGVPHDLVLARLERLLSDPDRLTRNVAAMALGGQRHNPSRAGAALLGAYERDFEDTVILSSVLDALREVGFLHYWPEAQRALRDERPAIVQRTLDLLAANRDHRALPRLVELYLEAHAAKAGAQQRPAARHRAELRACLKEITGVDFPDGRAALRWYLRNYRLVARLIAGMQGDDPVAAEAVAALELPSVRKSTAIWLRR